MQCRFCDNTNVKRFLELGEMSLANAFLTEDEVNTIKESRFPLDVFFCEGCGLVQIGHVVPPQDMFKDYIYFSSTSDAVHKHAEYLAQSFKERFKLEGLSLQKISQRWQWILGLKHILIFSMKRMPKTLKRSMAMLT